MPEKLKIIPLGGMHEIGKNLYVYEYGGDIVIVDCGMAFPDGDMLGIDLVIPDITYLKKHKSRIRGLIITHGHEDHIGSLPYVLKEINPPVFATPLAVGLIQGKLEEAGILKSVKINTIHQGSVITLGQFMIEAINVNHSTPDACALAIFTPIGTVIHTGDFKIDVTPVQGQMIDLARLGEIGKQGVLALLSDSTNAERPGYTMSERTVGETFDHLFKGSNQRLIVTTFASNVHRIQQIIESAVKYGRKVAISGRSMENILNLAVRLGYVSIPDGTLVDISRINSISKNKLVIITTGSQGETLSALYRMAFGTHRQVEIGSGDRIIISASPIPGNEKLISKVINELLKKGADVIYERLNALHVSGHACQEELKIMIGLTKPRYFMPIHGEFKHLRAHAKLALGMGIPSKNIFIGENGRVLEFTKDTGKLAGRVTAGQLMIDGNLGGDVGSVVLRDRRLLAEDGIIIVAAAMSADTGELLSGPNLICRGFVYAKEPDTLIGELTDLAARTMEECNAGKGDINAVKTAIKNALGEQIFKKSRRRPMILPVIMEV